MDKKYILFLCFTSILFGQISIGGVEDIERMSNDDLDTMREELTSPVPTFTPEIGSISVGTGDEEAMEEKIKSFSEYFGYSYFQRNINFFDNIPTPSDFKLGPGDEVILSLWGDTNLQKPFVINKEGSIYYEKVGFINIANKTLEEAESILIKKLSQTHSTLNNADDNSTNLTLDLGKLKSINVYFSGHIANPGINLIHPFSDIFSAIVQAQGINQEGSLRNVQLIRDGKVI